MQSSYRFFCKSGWLYEKISGLINIAERTFMLSMSKEIIEKAKKFDLFVAPLELRNYKILDPEKADELF